MAGFRGNLFLKKRHYGARLRRVMILMLVSGIPTLAFAPPNAKARPPSAPATPVLFWYPPALAGASIGAILSSAIQKSQKIKEKLWRAKAKNERFFHYRFQTKSLSKEVMHFGPTQDD